MARRRRSQFFNPSNNSVSYEGPTNVLQSVATPGNIALGEKRYTASDSLIGFWRFDTDVSKKGDSIDLSNSRNDATYALDADRPVFMGITPSYHVQSAANMWNGSDTMALAGSSEFWNKQVGPGDKSGLGVADPNCFTFAAWIRYSGSGEGTYPRIFEIGNDDLFVNFDNNNYLTFTRSFSEQAGIWRNGTSFEDNRWYHIGISYDARSSSNNPIFYIDGVKQASISETLTPAGNAMPIEDYGLQIGNRYAQDRTWHGNIASIGFWNEVIDQTSIESMYAARFGSYEDMSGYISLPARVRLREWDNMTGSYPTVLRTTGIKKPPFKNYFDDERAIVYKDTLNAVYPFLLNVSDFVKYGSNWQARPSGIVATIGADSSVGQSDGINTTGSVRPFVSDQWLKPSVYQEGEITPFDESRVYLDYSSQFYLTGTANNVTPGFSSGLGSKLNIKISLNTADEKKMTRWCTNGYSPDEITSFGGVDRNSGFYYFNFDNQVWEDIGLNDPVTEVEYGTTFFYVGTGASSAESPALPDHTVRAHSGYYADDTGHDAERWQPLKSYQFRMSPHTGHRASVFSQLKDDFGYGSIGAATMAGAAPYAPNYHATGSQVIKMSDYISHPIALEKAVLRMPVRAQMRFGNAHRDISGDEDAAVKLGGGAPDGAKPYGSTRDFDNYTFFVYRQARPGAYTRDSIHDVSGSKRYLVMSGCATFYNADAFNSNIITTLSSSALPHNPNFAHNFSINPSASFSPGLVGNYTGSLVIEMTPAVPAGGKWGSTRFALRSPSAVGDYGENITKTPTISVQDFWAGGTTSPNLFLSGVVPVIGAPDTNEYSVGMGNLLTGYFHRYDPALPTGPAVNTALIAGTSLDIPMPEGTRPLVGFPGRSQFVNFKQDVITKGWLEDPEGSPFVGPIAPTFTTNATSHLSPYILLPEDELVIGVDVGVSTTVTSGTYSGGSSEDDFYGRDDPELLGQTRFSAQNIISGSHMIIESGESSLTLFGSLVRLGVEKLPESGQPLTSDAIHEAIHYDNPVVDQFEINARSDYLSAYIDELITGSIKVNDGLSGAGVRGVAGSYSLGTADNTAGALLRAVRMRCTDETFFDSLMPDIRDFGRRSGFTVGTDKKQNLELVGASIVLRGIRRRADPFQTSEKRSQTQQYSLYQDNFSDQGGTFISSIRSNENTTRDIMFGVGWKYTISDGTILKESHYQTGSAKGFLYGIMNTRKLNSSAVFRYDRYGQYRDMLEQRMDGKYMTISSPPEESESSVNVKFVSSEDGTTPVSPNTTDSINLSTECTSSVPFREAIGVKVLAGIVRLKYDKIDKLPGKQQSGTRTFTARKPASRLW